MPMMSIQVTIPASGKVQVSTGIPSNFQNDILVQWLQFQNNAAHTVRYGDWSVSSTKGMMLANGSPGGAGSQSTPIGYSTMITDWWVAGTAGDVVDVLFIP